MSAINNENKNAAGRPFKMETWLEKLQEVLLEENILFLSDSDLRFLVNEKLDEKQQISKRTFENWKKGEFHPNEDIGKKFLACIEKALVKQRQYLGQKMLECDNSSWTKYAWVLERKFDEWNLKKISERINKNENTNIIHITAGNESQRQLIDNIINADFTEIKPLALPVNDKKKEDDYEF